MENKILFFGGSFNPIHTGHLILAQHCAEQLKIPRVVFLPTGNPPHKMLEIESKHRLQMLELALKGNELFEICHYEISKKEISYTYQSIEFLKREFQCEVYFFVGGDSLLDIHKWKEPKKILTNCNLVYAKRPGFELDIKMHLQSNNLPNDRIIEVPTPLIEISSTTIREKVKLGKSIKYYVPENVEIYIYQNNLYK
ncbi:nicotinate (nicotinamide) nucleotide adenylyltransferase [Alkalicella caledoniensis]|uniref:Probable nicotinate-nucleotide adenylyltransferase n=1 Tax=Alkalicella caledoniensis TaxID=2731377 RepID=A0A7G9W4H9_ALKCA|nr:nicotinate-nucleotide adenylyltransferase [Alkalicella caledoniensis]QNO13591.1 nicotinate (nicotinamide) nucleotide adenylyltransferase [Alkalicella caledoniensis]